MWKRLLPAIAGLVILEASAAVAGENAASVPVRPSIYVYVSVGDNQWVSQWPPIDSPATIEAMFDWLSKTYGVKRVYWRGEQDRMWLRHYEFRTEIPLYHDFWTHWLRHLNDSVKTNDLAVAAARRRGMEIYVFDGLFEHGAPGDAGGCGTFPYQAEDRLRIEHPEWCPVDRWGERVGAGPIEFCYPEARKALVDRYVRHVAEHGYDGIAFYTYVENFRTRYADEFGFNEPIVREFRRRHGVDIRTQPFDKEAWRKLRGEYVTQFLRELHAALAARGKKLSMTLRPDKPNLPQRWLAIETDIPVAGLIHMDWETWAKEGMVDELFSWVGPGTAALLRRMREVVKARKPAARPIELTSYSSSPFADSWRPFLAEGVHLCSVAAPGYGIDAWAVEPASLDSLKSPDWRLRAQAVADIGAGKLKSPDKNDAAAVSSLAKDPHVLVRREVMRALAALKAAGQVVLLETALDDPESSVRIAAATALANVYGAESPKCLVAALARDAGFQMKLACVDALAAMKQSAQPALLEGVKSDAVAIREVSVRALGRNGLADSMGPLLSALASDPDYRVRYFAASGLAGYRAPAVIDALRQAMSDPTPAVQLAAVKTLGAVAAAIPADKSAAALSALERLFRQYGDGCRRSDAAWGWRVVGGAILAFGDPGKRSLEAMRTQKQDRWLAWAAYLVLHVPELAERVAPCDENHAATIHEKFAPTFPGHRR